MYSFAIGPENLSRPQTANQPEVAVPLSDKRQSRRYQCQRCSTQVPQETTTIYNATSRMREIVQQQSIASDQLPRASTSSRIQTGGQGVAGLPAGASAKVGSNPVIPTNLFKRTFLCG